MFDREFFEKCLLAGRADEYISVCVNFDPYNYMILISDVYAEIKMLNA